MRLVLAAAAVLAPLAGAFAAADGAGDESAAARAWIAEARRAARPDIHGVPPPLPAAPPPSATDAIVADPFGLESGPRQAAPSPADAPPPAVRHADLPVPAPQVRLLGILWQEGAACAVVQVDGALYRVHPGDRLPGKLGRVLRIGEDALEIAGAGTLRMGAPGAGA